MSVSPRPADLQAHLGYWLRAVSNAVSHSFSRKVEGQGVTVAEWVFLRMLYDTERISPSLLAERMGMTKGAISKLADRLVGKELIQRDADPEDGRGQTLILRKSARKLVFRLAEVADRNDQEFFACLSSGERAQLETLLRKIATAQALTAHPTA